MISSGAFPNADAVACVMGCVFRRLPDQPGEWHETERGEHEIHGRPRVHEEVDKNRERRKSEQSREDAPGHGPVRY